MACEHNPIIVNDSDCPCTADCVRHGKCCECVQRHISHVLLPACLREHPQVTGKYTGNETAPSH